MQFQAVRPPLILRRIVSPLISTPIVGAGVAETIDSRAFSDFCGVDSSNQVPDGDTLGRFRNLLIRNGIQEKLFAQVTELLLGTGTASGKRDDRRFNVDLRTVKHQKRGKET